MLDRQNPEKSSSGPYNPSGEPFNPQGHHFLAPASYATAELNREGQVSILNQSCGSTKFFFSSVVFLTTNTPAVQILCFNIKYLSGQVCPLSEDHVSLTALLRWPKKWLIMTCDSDTYSGSLFPFFSLPVRQREAKGMFREGGARGVFCLFLHNLF